ncbi:hypothetical protein [Tautonia plasticadhaerens]|uniref:Uncharacterized protein n=1 Tax=Tautonia plasticadhaerens TaxID=2527974 RepID=A0A518HAQ3_9BACT|nr:hypothetical protein [Tautonia plasticadhaerens]QDV37930.1 hypothetical protein ElP_58770 [Tautonia plasticadhaerens]
MMKRSGGLARFVMSHVMALAIFGAVGFVLFRFSPLGDPVPMPEAVVEPAASTGASGPARPTALTGRVGPEAPEPSPSRSAPEPQGVADVGPSPDGPMLVALLDATSGDDAADSGEDGAAREGRPPEDDEETEAEIGPLDPRAEALADYDRKRAEAGDGRDDRAGLASWCDANGLWTRAESHWREVLDRSPIDRVARGRLGYRLVGGEWAVDPAQAEGAAQRKADLFWGKALGRLHSRMHRGGSTPGAVRDRAEVESRIEAVGDPRSAPALWEVFAGHAAHHAMIVRVVGRFESARASQILAALAVYSADEKARAAALDGLRGRDPKDFAAPLVSLMGMPLDYEVREVPGPGRRPARMLFVQGERADYAYVFFRHEAPDAFSGPITASIRVLPERQAARRYNEQQAAIARAAFDRQVEQATQAVEGLNRQIRLRNEQVALVLNSACGAGIGPDVGDARRWAASLLGEPFSPSAVGPKPTISQVVPPLYAPSFLPVPVPT